MEPKGISGMKISEIRDYTIVGICIFFGLWTLCHITSLSNNEVSRPHIRFIKRYRKADVYNSHNFSPLDENAIGAQLDSPATVPQVTLETESESSSSKDDDDDGDDDEDEDETTTDNLPTDGEDEAQTQTESDDDLSKEEETEAQIVHPKLLVKSKLIRKKRGTKETQIYFDLRKDGFLNMFYYKMIQVAICLTHNNDSRLGEIEGCIGAEYKTIIDVTKKEISRKGKRKEPVKPEKRKEPNNKLPIDDHSNDGATDDGNSGPKEPSLFNLMAATKGSNRQSGNGILIIEKPIPSKMDVVSLLSLIKKEGSKIRNSAVKPIKNDKRKANIKNNNGVSEAEANAMFDQIKTGSGGIGVILGDSMFGFKKSSSDSKIESKQTSSKGSSSSISFGEMKQAVLGPIMGMFPGSSMLNFRKKRDADVKKKCKKKLNPLIKRKKKKCKNISTTMVNLLNTETACTDKDKTKCSDELIGNNETTEETKYDETTTKDMGEMAENSETMNDLNESTIPTTETAVKDIDESNMKDETDESIINTYETTTERTTTINDYETSKDTDETNMKDIDETTIEPDETTIDSDITRMEDTHETSALSSDETSTLGTDETTISTVESTINADETSALGSNETSTLGTDETTINIVESMINADETSALGSDEKSRLGTDEATIRTVETTINTDETITLCSDETTIRTVKTTINDDEITIGTEDEIKFKVLKEEKDVEREKSEVTFKDENETAIMLENPKTTTDENNDKENNVEKSPKKESEKKIGFVFVFEVSNNRDSNGDVFDEKKFTKKAASMIVPGLAKKAELDQIEQEKSPKKKNSKISKGGEYLNDTSSDKTKASMEFIEQNDNDNDEFKIDNKNKRIEGSKKTDEKFQEEIKNTNESQITENPLDFIEYEINEIKKSRKKKSIIKNLKIKESNWESEKEDEDFISSEDEGKVNHAEVKNFFRHWDLEEKNANKTYNELYTNMEYVNAHEDYKGKMKKEKVLSQNYKYLGEFYEEAFVLKNYKNYITSFLHDRSLELSQFTLKVNEKHTSIEAVRKLFIAFIVEVHHWNLFFDYMRSYGFSSKHRPQSPFPSISKISNEIRLAINIVLRSLEFMRNDRIYNENKFYLKLLLELTIKETAYMFRFSKSKRGFNGARTMKKLFEHVNQTINVDRVGETNKDKFVHETKLYEEFSKTHAQ